MVEAAFADHPWHVAILVEKPAGPVDVGAEEGSGYQGNGHNFGGGESNLGIVVKAAHGLQEVVTQAVDGGYGIVQDVLPIQERLCGLRIGRILSASIGGNLGYLPKSFEQALKKTREVWPIKGGIFWFCDLWLC